MEDSKLKVVSKELVVTDDLIIPGTTQIDLTKILEKAMEVSGLHDNYLQSQLNVKFIQENHTWVITQYEIRILKEAELNATLEIDTRLIEVNRFFCTRRYSVVSDGQLLYEVFSKFAAIDMENRRIVRINPAPLETEDIIDSSYTIEFSKIKAFTNVANEEDIRVGIDANDIDENLHVNNLVYLRWAYRTIPSDISQNYKMKRIEVKYEKEILPQDTVAICNQADLEESNQTQQVIINESNNKIASVINIEWEK